MYSRWAMFAQWGTEVAGIFKSLSGPYGTRGDSKRWEETFLHQFIGWDSRWQENTHTKSETSHHQLLKAFFSFPTRVIARLQETTPDKINCVVLMSLVLVVNVFLLRIMEMKNNTRGTKKSHKFDANISLLNSAYFMIHLLWNCRTIWKAKELQKHLKTFIQMEIWG